VGAASTVLVFFAVLVVLRVDAGAVVFGVEAGAVFAGAFRALGI